MSMSAKGEIVQEAGELEIDDTLTIVCPFCEEDWKRQGRPAVWRPSRSLAITRNTEGLLYHCYRATCARGNPGGFISARPASSLDYITKKPKKKKQPKPFKWGTNPLSNEQFDFFKYKYGLTGPEIEEQGFKWAPEIERVVMPVMDIRGYEYAVNARWYVELADWSNAETKAILYFDNVDVPRMHFPARAGYSTSKPLYLVEDIISAIKVSRYAQCAALLGTNVGPDIITHLAEIGFQDIRIMLDPDATGKAIAVKRKYNLYFRNLSVVVLSKKDPKDLSEGELLEVLN